MKQLYHGIILLFVAGMLALSCKENSTEYEFPYQNPALSPTERAEDLVSRLDIKQKISLMKNHSSAVEEFGIKEYDWWSEALHGSARSGLATVFPQAIGMAASFDDALLQQVFDIASTEQRAKFANERAERGGSRQYYGLTVWTPNINIFRDPRWGRGQETYGEDPYLTATMGTAVVKGLQGPEDAIHNKLHACLKHYAVHSGPESSRHSFNVEDVSYRDLKETYLYAFERIIKTTDVKEVMCAYNAVDGRPCCGSDNLLKHFLREEWGYEGLVVSDCGAISDFYRPGGHRTYPDDRAAASANAVLTGTDLECGDAYNALLSALDRGLIKEEDIDVSVRRLMKARFELGEMDEDSSIEWNHFPMDTLDCDAHQAVALKMAHESMTLLYNDGILPLSKTGVKYAVLGYNAGKVDVNYGNYNGFPKHCITALEGIQTKLGDNAPVRFPGPGLVDAPSEAATREVLQVVKDVDVVIYVGGISPRLEGEELPLEIEGFKGGDRTSIELPKVQRELLKALKEAGKKVVFVNMSGSALALQPETESCNAILQAWYGGEKAGEAIADVLFGDYNPSGKLPVTFYASTEDLPDFEDYEMEDRTYRYFKGDALFPFGYGLSYTDFELGEARLCKGRSNKPVNTFKSTDKLFLKVPVTNTGTMDGAQVVQVYIRKAGDYEGPKYSLRGFKRVEVKVGETVEAIIPMDEFNFAVFNEMTGNMETTQGEYTLFYGTSSAEEDLTGMTIYCKK